MGSTTNPGFKMRLTRRAFEYANEVAIEELTKEIQSTSLKDVHGDAHHLNYDIASIRVKSFTKPSSSLTPQSDGIRWSASNAGIEMEADFRYKYRKHMVKISDHGRITAGIQGLSFDVIVCIERLPDGKPSCKAVNCNANIDHLGVKFHGGTAWIYNLFRDNLAHNLKRSLQPKIVEAINKLINVDGQRALDKLKMTTNLGSKFLLDYSLSSDIVYNSDCVESNQKGEVFWKENVREADVPNPPLPVVADNSKMIYFWLSEYAISTLMWQAQNNNFLTYTFTRNDLDPDQKHFLDICNDYDTCIGDLIPQLKQAHPGYHVDMEMRSCYTPKVNIMDGKIQGEMGGEIELLAVKDGLSDRHLICRFSTSMLADVQLSIRNEMLYGHMEASNINLKVEETNFDLIPELFSFALNRIVQKFVAKKVNDVMQAGVPIPVKEKVQLIDAEIRILPHAVVICSDLRYVNE